MIKPLPELQLPPCDLQMVLKERETVRSFNVEQGLNLEQLSALLWAGQGNAKPGAVRLTETHGAFRQWPVPAVVAGVCPPCAGLIPGVYGYNGASHSLNFLDEGERSAGFAAAAIGDQPWLADAAAVIVVLADIQSMRQAFAEQAPGAGAVNAMCIWKPVPSARTFICRLPRWGWA
ncbi:hypothetical protein [Aliamphritea spongicola]|nr:hypothetical protein [Aliamphritea spongicola]